MARKNEAHEIVIESITIALLQLMEKKPLAEINVSELCILAGVGRVSFYRNFSSLQDILTKYLNKCSDEWWNGFIQRPKEEFYSMFWTELLMQYKKNEKLIGLLYKNNILYLLKEHIFSCCGPKPEHDTKTAYICSMLAGCIYGLVDEWIRRGMTDFPQALDMENLFAYMNREGVIKL